MDPTQLQTPEQMLDRWDEIECICDPAVGHLCECCHDTQVVRELLKERDRLREGVKAWAYCTSEGMKAFAPEKVNDLADFLLSCNVSPYYIRNRRLETHEII